MADIIITWKYLFHISSVKSVGINNIPSVDNLWDENGYHIRAENKNAKAKQESEKDVINSYGQKGWELVSITRFLSLSIEMKLVKHLN